MVAAVITVTALGTYHMGASEIWDKALNAGRIQFLK
jgi:hypothetical protein